ncbi:MAG: ribosome silencing factor [Bacteroidetes bacterium]|jgi:ribosome-associated protein|nr:ribosome silencing factor [Bacteroidota bacterium]MBT3748256.1 ribosome silencing factor [Bacteroidota bacterium]MBT4400194.1 ribosome silencing factor [Bacteroidota bacterium]MBT4408773.1 ribosome silencing factor [Bacteroidota bacterium]MBT5426152.1 ribosome silencing factor [Bacteroidota bacterium]
MQDSQNKKELQEILDIIIEAIRNTMGQDIMDINLTKLDTIIARHFVICHAESFKQVRSIAEEIEDQLVSQRKTKPYHKEGMQNSIWILLDYQDIIVHIFQHDYRSFYRLEELWADGVTTKYDS